MQKYRDLLEIMQKVSFSAQLFSISLRKMWDRFAKTKLRIRMKYLVYQKLWCFHPWSRAKFNCLQNGKESNLSEILSHIVFEKVKVDSCTNWRLNQCQLVADHQRRSLDTVLLSGIHPGKMHSIWGWEGRGGFWIPHILSRSTSHNWECQNWNMKSKQSLKTPWKGECPIFGESKNLSLSF